MAKKLLKELMIGDVILKNNIISAPLAGISDWAFRTIVSEYYPGLICTEMVSAEGLVRGNKKTLELINLEGKKTPICVQIFGSNIDTLSKAAEILNKYDFEILDLNCGCSVPKVTNGGSGSALLRDTKKLYNIVKSIADVSNKPLTVKIRSGWDHNSINYIENSLAIQEAGAKAITIHPRTKSDKFKNHSNWEHIKILKEKLKIPVIGNGDIKTIFDAQKMIEQTNCDGIMIGRALIGNPFLILEIKNYFTFIDSLQYSQVNQELNETLNEKPIEEIVRESQTQSNIQNLGYKYSNITNNIDLLFNTLLKHLQLIIENKGINKGIKEFRKFLVKYTKGLPNSADFRAKACLIEDYSILIDTIQTYYKYNYNT